jgi:hypothetical protein
MPTTATADSHLTPGSYRARKHLPAKRAGAAADPHLPMTAWKHAGFGDVARIGELRITMGPDASRTRKGW